MNPVFYWIGVAAALGAAIAALAGLFWLAGGLFILAGDRMVRKGLRVLTIANWRYWNGRMLNEGLIAMPKFYAETVAARQPKTTAQFEAAEREAEARESAAHPNTGASDHE